MAVEIERKFLVHDNMWKSLFLIKKVEIKQGYLHKTRNTTTRIRVADDLGYLTIKGPRVDIECAEYEYEVPLADAIEIMKMCIGPCIKKTRHYIRDEYDQVWDIDVFKGINRGLTIAEIELTSKNQLINIPSWVSTEVSHDRRYTNAYLADHKVT